MLGFFPTPYPDELLYSMLCRIHRILGAPKGHTFSRMVFGDNRTTTGVLFPKNVGKLMANMPPEHTLTEQAITGEHTLEPLYRAFYHKRSLRAEPYFLFSCPTCRKEDETQLGETYWHRSHQVPHGKVCYKHGTSLEQATKEYRDPHHIHKIRTPNYFLPSDTDWEKLAVGKRELEIHQRFNARVQTILQTQAVIAPDHLETFKAAAILQGFGIGNNPFSSAKGAGLKSQELHTVILEKLGDLAFDLFQMKHDAAAAREDLAVTLRGKEPMPHRHLLLYEIFGLGVFERVERPIPKPIPEKETPYRRHPLKKIAETRKRHRANLLKLIRENPKATRGELLALGKSTHQWLKRYDRDWFDRHYAKVKIGHRTNYSRSTDRKETKELGKKALQLHQNEGGKPIPITLSRLIKLLPKKEGRRLKLLAANSDYAEKLILPLQTSPKELYLERIRWGLKQIEGQNIKYRDFCKLTGIRHGLQTVPGLDGIAKSALETHRKGLPTNPSP